MDLRWAVLGVSWLLTLAIRLAMLADRDGLADGWGPEDFWPERRRPGSPADDDAPADHGA